MINLIKIELKKLFAKKVIYIFMIVLFCLTLGMSILEKKVSVLFDTIEYRINGELYKQAMDSYDLSDPQQLEYYVDDKTYYDTLMLAKDYDTYSAEYVYVYGDVNESIKCMNENEFINKDQDAYNACKAEYDKQIEFLKHFDWKKLVDEKKEETKLELQGIDSLVETGELSKEMAENQKKVLNLTLDIYDYRLKNNIPLDASGASIELEQLPDSYALYLSIDEEKNYVDYQQRKNRTDIEEEYLVAKYKLDHDLIVDTGRSIDSSTSADSVLTVFNGGMMTILFLLLIGGGIVAEEFNKGTIKQLLLKPYTRTKLLTSKILAVLITFTAFMFIYAIMTGIINGLVFGDIEALFRPVVVYNFTSKTVTDVNIIIRCCQLFLAILPMFLILFGISLVLGVLTTNTSLSLIVPLAINIAAPMINLLARGKFFAFLPTMCWDLREFLDGGMPSFKYSTLPISILVDIATIFILYFIAYAVFKKKDIKNQ